MKKATVAVLLWLASTSCHALVDMRNGNYSERWTDLEIKGAGYDLRVMRVYNSRTAYDGLFGRGWCTEFESRIEPQPDGTLKHTECGAGEEVIFRASAIKPSRYLGRGKQFDAIERDAEGFHRRMADGSIEAYDADGRLLRMSDANGNFLQLDYRDGKLWRVVRNDGDAIEFAMGENGKVASIKGPAGEGVSYRYADGNLVGIVHGFGSNGAKAYAHDWDSRHRMVRTTWMDNTFTEIKYDAKHDWVTQFTARSGCVETYTYRDEADDPRNHYSTTLAKKCPAAEPDGESYAAEGEFEYWHALNADGERYIARIRSVVNGNERDVRYHERLRLPVSIERDGDRYVYEYYPNGLLKSRVSQFARIEFKYGKIGKATRVTTAILSEDGKVFSRKVASFGYDERGNLNRARNDEGQSIRLDFDLDGRIVRLRDNRRHDLSIGYDTVCNRPALIEERGLGRVEVTYKADCEIDKVNSEQSPAVTMQVTSLFNNLLEVIAPATMEVYE